MTSSPELPDDTAALCAAVAAFIRPGLRETRAIMIADAFAEEVQLRASEFAAEHNALIELAAVVRGEVRPDLRQAHPDWRLEALLTEELQLRKADADEATRVAVDGLKQLYVASIAAMQKTIDDLAQANEQMRTQRDEQATELLRSIDVFIRPALRPQYERTLADRFDEEVRLREQEREELEDAKSRAEKGEAEAAASWDELIIAVREIIRPSLFEQHSGWILTSLLAEELRLRAADHAEGFANARIDLAAATADRDEARNRAAALEAGLRDMERRVVQSQSRIIDLHTQIERRDHRASEIEAAIVDLVVAHHRACSNERIMRAALPDPRRAEPAAAEKSTVRPL